MINDILDILNPRGQFTATAKYYDTLPSSPDDGGQKFSFEYVSPYSKTYQRIFANIQGEPGNVIIRTNKNNNYSINGIIITQDGKAYRIKQVEKEYPESSKQVQRLFISLVNCTYLISLEETDEPWGIS